jgi:hypothetical protein
MPSLVKPAVHERATVPPRDQATIDLGPIPPPDVPEPARVRDFGDDEIASGLRRFATASVARGRSAALEDREGEIRSGRSVRLSFLTAFLPPGRQGRGDGFEPNFVRHSE